MKYTSFIAISCNSYTVKSIEEVVDSLSLRDAISALYCCVEIVPSLTICFSCNSEYCARLPDVLEVLEDELEEELVSTAAAVEFNSLSVAVASVIPIEAAACATKSAVDALLAACAATAWDAWDEVVTEELYCSNASVEIVTTSPSFDILAFSTPVCAVFAGSLACPFIWLVPLMLVSD